MTVTDARTVEDRLAAIEAVLFPQLTNEQVEEFKAEFGRRVSAGEFEHPRFERVPPGPPLTRGQVTQLLRECVTVVKPGETLAIRANGEWAPRQVEQFQQFLDDLAEWRDLGVKLLVLPGEEFAVVTGSQAKAQGSGRSGQDSGRPGDTTRARSASKSM